jgi:hypothetical protein
MVKVKWNEEKKEWETLEKNSPDGIYLDGYLKQKLDNIKMIQKKNWDCFFIIDGFEGSGKTTLGSTCAYYLSDTKVTPNNICKSAKEAKSKLGTFPDESVLIVDEGDLAFSSGDVFTQEQKELIKITKVIRYKKMVLIIIAPCFFDLNRKIAVRRSRFLLHVYTGARMDRGKFAYFGQKKKEKLYTVGKKNFSSYSTPEADFIAKFTDFHPFGDAYDEVKEEIVRGILEDKPKEDVWHAKYDSLIISFLNIAYPILNKQDLLRKVGIDSSFLYKKKKNAEEKLENMPILLGNRG